MAGAVVKQEDGTAAPVGTLLIQCLYELEQVGGDGSLSVDAVQVLQIDVTLGAHGEQDGEAGEIFAQHAQAVLAPWGPGVPLADCRVDDRLVEVKEPLPLCQSFNEVEGEELPQLDVIARVDVDLVCPDDLPSQAHLIPEQPTKLSVGDAHLQVLANRILQGGHRDDTDSAVELTLHYLRHLEL